MREWETKRQQREAEGGKRIGLGTGGNGRVEREGERGGGGA